MSDRFKILVGMPGPSCTFQTCQALMFASREHDIMLENVGASCDNFQLLFAHALNLAEEGRITHFAMLHADINPQDYWLDALVREAEKRGVSFLSAVAPVKDERGLASCGIGDPRDPWLPFRQFTMAEVLGLPETFDQADAGYSGYPLLHNNGCCLWDLRDTRFFARDGRDELICSFIFARRMIRDGEGKWLAQRASEDWEISRRFWQMGIPTAISRKVKLTHCTANFVFANDRAWGQAHDESTRSKWETNPGRL